MKKGFTLVELLAVIVILAIIALIAIPQITKVVTKVRKSASINSAYGYVDAIEKQIVQEGLKSTAVTLTNGTHYVEDMSVNYKGKGPDEGVVTIEKGSVKSAKLCIGKYSIDYDGNEASISSNSYCSSTYTVVLNINGNKQSKELKKVNSTTFEVDITNMTNMSCNNGSIPSIENNTLTISNIYGDTECIINNSIKDTIDNLDNSEINIVMLNGETISDSLTIKEGKTVNLDLNGKTIKSINYDNTEIDGSVYNSEDSILIVNGSVVLNNSSDTESKLLSPPSARTIDVNGGYIIINGGYYIGRQAVGSTNANVIINDGTFDSNKYSTLTSYINGNFTINNGTFNTLQYIIYNQINGIITINEGIFNSSDITIYNQGGTGTININGGTFISDNGSAIRNNSTGIINITQTDIPIYITSLAQTWAPAIRNYGSGTINITANQADNCTSNSEDTTIGLCIYAIGDKGVLSDTSGNSVIQNRNDGGIVNIDGGTYIGGSQVISNGGTNTNIIRIQNAYIKSYGNSIQNNSAGGIINICNSIIKSTNYDLINQGTTTGTINYDTSTIFTSGDNTPVVANNLGTINANYTGTCTE